MVTYTAHERGQDGPDIPARAQGIVFVKEGMAWWALVFPILWLIYHRMWIVLAGFVGVMVALELALTLLGLPNAISVLCSIFLSLMFALLANDLRRWTLERNGYAFAGLASGRDLQECELRFFDGWLAAQEPAAAAPAAPPAKPQATAATGRASGGQGDDVIGLFPEPGR